MQVGREHDEKEAEGCEERARGWGDETQRRRTEPPAKGCGATRTWETGTQTLPPTPGISTRNSAVRTPCFEPPPQPSFQIPGLQTRE